MCKKSYIFIFLSFLFSTSCSNKNNQISKEVHSFKTFNPKKIDTIYNEHYICDLQSIEHIEIRNKIKGFVESVNIDEGQYVYKGQLMFKLSSKLYEEELIRAKANVKSVLAEAKAAEINFNNLKKLRENNIVSETEFELSQLQYEAAKSKIEAAKSEENSAMVNLISTEIKAPFSGYVNRILKKRGSLLEEGTLLTSLSNNSKMYGYFNVSENEYYELKLKNENKKVIKLVLANGEYFENEGIIETEEGEFDKSTGSISFRAVFENKDGLLKHGSTGKVEIKNSIKDVYLIPQKSTFEIQDKIFIYVLNKETNKVSTKLINPIKTLTNFYIVRDGISENDKIIFEGVQHLTDGEIVNPIHVNLKDEFENDNTVKEEV